MSDATEADWHDLDLDGWLKHRKQRRADALRVMKKLTTSANQLSQSADGVSADKTVAIDQSELANVITPLYQEVADLHGKLEAQSKTLNTLDEDIQAKTDEVEELDARDKRLTNQIKEAYKQRNQMKIAAAVAAVVVLAILFEV